METINHPEHYNRHPSGIECIDYVENMSFNLGNAVKYLWRATLKGKPAEDLKKARWYCQREIERRKGLVLRGIVVDTYTPHTMEVRAQKIIASESSAWATHAHVAFFQAHQAALDIKPLYDAIVYIDSMLSALPMYEKVVHDVNT